MKISLFGFLLLIFGTFSCISEDTDAKNPVSPMEFAICFPPLNSNT